MTSNLKYTLTANSTAIGVNHSTNETFTFNTGATCATDGACIMNGNTVMTEQVTNGGYYYNWYAATAGTGTSSMASGDATGSICPKGWRLPANYTSDQNRSFSNITLAYLNISDSIEGDYTTILEDAPIRSFRSGFYIDASYFGGYGVYRTSTASGNSNSFRFGYDENGVFTQVSDAKSRGFSVRCVAQ